MNHIDSKETCLFSPIFNQQIKGKMDYVYNHSVLINDFFDFEVCKTILEYATPDSDIIDIGANIGLVTLGIKRLLELNGAKNYVNKFHCFECNDDTFSYLKHNTSQHNDIVLYHFGLSDSPQIANMEINDYNYGCNMVKQIYDHKGIEILEYGFQTGSAFTENKMFISLIPLDLFYTIFEKKISVIKIDVEGMEYKVLVGAKNLIEKFKPVIIVEIFDQNLTKTNELMASYHYTNKGLIPKKYVSQDYLFTYSGDP